MKQLAYYYAVPHGAKLSRLSELNILNKKMILPKIKKGYYLITYLEEMGYCTNTGEHTAPITFNELNAWVESSGLQLTHNERLHIKRLSESFVRALSESAMKGAMPYYTEGSTNVSSKFREAVKVLNKK